MVLITYDVDTTDAAGRKRLHRVAKLCVDHGQRVQHSVFECLMEPQQFAELKRRLLQTMNPDKDSLRFYMLGANWRRRIEHVGAKPSYDPEGVLMA